MDIAISSDVTMKIGNSSAWLPIAAGEPRSNCVGQGQEPPLALRKKIGTSASRPDSRH
jgi:hypothetical protein